MTQLRELTASLRHRDFRLLWSSQTLSVIGDQIITVAMALFIIDLTGSATDLGIVLAAHSLPLVAFVLVGGIWADRLPRHRVVVVTDLIRFALQAVLAILIFTDAVAGLAPGRDLGAVRDRRGLLPARRHGAAAPDGARGRDPGGQRAHLDVEQRRRVRRPCARDPARPRRRRGDRVRARRRDLPRQRGGRDPRCAPAAGRGRGPTGSRSPAGLARGAARRLSRGPLAHVGLGDAAGVLRRRVHRARALVRARAAGRRPSSTAASPSTGRSPRCSAPGRSSAR